MKNSFYILCFLVFFTSSCTVDEQLLTEDEKLTEALLSTSYSFPDIPFPADNAFTLDRWNLGKRMFFDPILSRDGSISCASCHNQSVAFADDRSFSLGVEERVGERNSISLANVAFLPHLLREGGVPTLEQQVLVPINEHSEFDNNILIIAERMNEDSTYIHASLSAYDRIPDPFVISRALATFQRTLISDDSDYDKQLQNPEQHILSESALRGQELFFSEALACSSCHAGFLFSDHSFQNNGLYDVYEDEGRFLLTLNESDRALFKVPSLRNVALTPPYMHDGSLESLEDVIEHYNSGGVNHPNKSQQIVPLGLSDSKKSDLIAFLNSLTDYSFVNNPLFKPE